MIKHKITDRRTAVLSLCLLISIPPFRQGDHLLVFKNIAFALYGIGAGFDG